MTDAERLATIRIAGITDAQLAALASGNIVLWQAEGVRGDEREACARIASSMSGGACDERGTMENETGEVPCGAESRGDVCVCAERSELAFKIADKIRARGA